MYVLVPIEGTSDPVEYEQQPVAHATSCEVSFTHSAREVLTKDSGGDTGRLPGLRDWSLSCEALYANDYNDGIADDRQGMTELYTALKNGDKLMVKFSSEVQGDYEFEGHVFLTDLSMNAGMEENASYSASFAGTGAIEMELIEGESEE